MGPQNTLTHLHVCFVWSLCMPFWVISWLSGFSTSSVFIYLFQVIKTPMDFSTIKKKMVAKNGSGYKHVREVCADVRLIFKNAMVYNDQTNDVHIMARFLLDKFEEKWLKFLPNVTKEVTPYLFSFTCFYQARGSHWPEPSLKGVFGIWFGLVFFVDFWLLACWLVKQPKKFW